MLNAFSNGTLAVPSASVNIKGIELIPIECDGQRVVTLAMVDQLHKRNSGTARRNYNNQRERFIEGKHAFVKNLHEARELGITAPNGLVLLTERGYLLLAQSFRDDLSYAIREMLIDCYFHVRSQIISPASVLPYHLQRYQVNRLKIPGTHFSMLEQMNLKLLASLEAHGYIVPARMMPDISLGKMFSSWLRSSGFDPDSFPTYQHEFLDGVRPVVEARLYPLQLLLVFNEKLDDWIQSGKALTYFAERDKAAIEPIKAVRSEYAALSAAYPTKPAIQSRRFLT